MPPPRMNTQPLIQNVSSAASSVPPDTHPSLAALQVAPVAGDQFATFLTTFASEADSDFCATWESIGPILAFTSEILGYVPGVPAVVTTIINDAVAKGNALQKTLCQTD